MTAKELYQALGKIINQGYGDCFVTTNFENDIYSNGANYNFIDEIDVIELNGKNFVNLFEN